MAFGSGHTCLCEERVGVGVYVLLAWTNPALLQMGRRRLGTRKAMWAPCPRLPIRRQEQAWNPSLVQGSRRALSEP